jgi:hypothetical protein
MYFLFFLSFLHTLIITSTTAFDTICHYFSFSGARVAHDSVIAVGQGHKDWAHFLTWTVGKLFAHKPLMAVRIFVWGLQSASTVDEWKVSLPACEKGVSPEAYTVMCEEFKIQEDGKMVL